MTYGTPMPMLASAASATSGCDSSTRKHSPLEQQPQREHQRQHDEKDQSLAAAEPQMTGAGHGPRRRADENMIGDCARTDALAGTRVQFTSSL